MSTTILFLKLFRLSFYTFFSDPKTSLSIFWYTVKSFFRVKKYHKSGCKKFFLNEFKKESKSDTVFILGSGPSINELKNSDWELISKNDSWGFNYWFCHDHIPDCFFAQSEVKSFFNDLKFFSELDNLMAQMLIDKKVQYEKVRFYLRGDSVNDYTFHETQFGKTILFNNFNYYFISELVVSSKNKVMPFKLINKIHKLGFFSSTTKHSPIPKLGNTITELISLAIMAGYKNIVLCGIDMNDGGHFYDTDAYLNKYSYLRKLKAWSNRNVIHPHMDTSTKKYNTKEIIMDLEKFAKSKFDSQIYVSSDSSQLYPDLPKYF